MAYARMLLTFERALRLGAHSYPKMATARAPHIRQLAFNGRILARYMATSSEREEHGKSQGIHNIMRDTEKPIGEANVLDFQAETRQLLDIVAHSLYSDKEVFVRELISNASDALEKFRYSLLTSDSKDMKCESADRPLEIHVGTDKTNMKLTIQDTGIGMTREELISNLGTIARSGSKQFLEKIKEKSEAQENSANIIGQFGVGFYSAFMAADRVEVFTRSSHPNSPGLRWVSDGSGTYEIQEAEGVAHGTKIVLHLKTSCREYADEDTVKGVIKKYSNFVGSPIYVNGVRCNEMTPLWLKDAKEITPDQHTEFYRFIGNSFDKPRFVLHYKVDVPRNIIALIYFPSKKPVFYDMARDADMGVSLYTRKVLIQAKTQNLLPKWLRFVKGVVDSEDIPLNLSRELLQNSILINSIRKVLTARVIKYLHQRSSKEPTEYAEFYKDYGIFFKEGIVSTPEHEERQDLASLLRFESSATPAGTTVSLDDYLKTVGDQQNIYYLAAPNRKLAESSPYFEGLKKRNKDVLFCYEPHDELVFLQLGQYKDHVLVSAEKEMRDDKSDDNVQDYGEGSLTRMQLDELLPWIREQLSGKIGEVKATTHLESYPCVVTVEDMAAARQFLRTTAQELADVNRYALLQPHLEINPKHPVIKKINTLRTSDPELADLLIKQLFANAMVAAGLSENASTVLSTMNELLAKMLEKF